MIKMFGVIVVTVMKNKNTHHAVPAMFVGLWETDIKML